MREVSLIGKQKEAIFSKIIKVIKHVKAEEHNNLWGKPIKLSISLLTQLREEVDRSGSCTKPRKLFEHTINTFYFKAFAVRTSVVVIVWINVEF